MGWLSKKIFNTNPSKHEKQLAMARSYIEEQTALYRHYNIQGIQDILRGKIGNQGHIASLSDSEIAKIVQEIRDEKGMGPTHA